MKILSVCHFAVAAVFAAVGFFVASPAFACEQCSQTAKTCSQSKTTPCGCQKADKVSEKKAGEGQANVDQDKLASATLSVEGWHCASCASRTESVLTNLDGVISAQADFGKKAVVIRFDKTQIDVGTLKKAVTDAGFKLASSS